MGLYPQTTPFTRKSCPFTWSLAPPAPFRTVTTSCCAAAVAGRGSMQRTTKRQSTALNGKTPLSRPIYFDDRIISTGPLKSSVKGERQCSSGGAGCQKALGMAQRLVEVQRRGADGDRLGAEAAHRDAAGVERRDREPVADVALQRIEQTLLG